LRRLPRFLASFTRFIAAVLIAAALALALLLIGQRVFSPFHVVISNSMYPQIRTGDAVVVKNIDGSEIKVGEVIIFRDPSKPDDLIIHRVVSVAGDGQTQVYGTKGDNNPVNDDWQVNTGEVVGGVAVTFHKFGWFLDFLQSPKGYVTCIAVPTAISILLVFLLGVMERLNKLRIRKMTGFHVDPTGQSAK
jgi:signal peptidase I